MPGFGGRCSLGFTMVPFNERACHPNVIQIPAIIGNKIIRCIGETARYRAVDYSNPLMRSDGLREAKFAWPV
ncbi:MAG: hypothetical protein U0Y68_24210 [Blastocatellia bacterium]